MNTSLTPDLLNALLEIATDEAYPQNATLDSLQNEQWLLAEVASLCQQHIVTPETILQVKSYIEKEAPDAPLYASNPQQAERLGTLAYLLGQPSAHPGPAFGYWLLANSYMFTEKAKDATILYEQARADFVQQGDPDNHTIILSIGYLAALAQTGQPRRALTLAAQLEPLFTAQGSLANHVKLLMNIGASHEFLGEYEEALAIYRRQMPLAQELDDPLRLARIRHNQAYVLVRLNLFQEALHAFEEAKAGFTTQGATLELSRLHTNLSQLYAQWGDYAKALEQLTHIENTLLQKDTDELTRCWLIWLRSKILLESQQTIDGSLVSALKNAEQLFQQRGNTYGRGLVLLSLAQCALRCQEWTGARQALEKAKTIVTSSVGLTLGYQVAHGLGQLAEAQGEIDAAIEQYEESLSQIETMRHTLLTENFRNHFVADKLHVYHDLIQLYIHEGRYDQSFQTAERIKSRLLAERLHFSLNNETATLTRATDQRVRRLAQQLQENLETIQHYTLAELSNSESTISSNTDQLASLEQHVQELIDQIQRDQPLLSPLATGEVVEVERVQSQLATYSPHSIFLQYQIIGDQVWVLPLAATQILTPLALASVQEINHLRQLLYAALMRILQLHIRRGPAFVMRALPALLGDTQQLLHKLYELLVAPLLNTYPEYLSPKTHLLIAPDNILYYIPFHALYDGEQYLLERNIISYIPSATVLDLCLQARQRQASSGFHHSHPFNASLFGYSGADLANVEQELAQIVCHLPHAAVYAQEQATTENFIAAASDYNLLHIAAHAHFRIDNPLLSAIQLADRGLTLGEIARLPLRNCALAVLSGCETGYGQLQGADLLSLAGGFLGAGVRSLLVSLWRVDDESTARLMDSFYGTLTEGQDCATALCQAQLNLLNEARSATDHRQIYSHPAYWAAFILNGDWGLQGYPQP